MNSKKQKKMLIGFAVIILLIASVFVAYTFLPKNDLFSLSAGTFETGTLAGWTAIIGSPTVVNSGAYEGLYCMQVPLDSLNYVWIDLPSVTSATVDVAVKVSSLPQAQSGDAFVVMWAGSTPLVSAGIANSGSGAQWILATGAAYYSSTPTIIANQWYVMRLQYDSVAGSAVLSINTGTGFVTVESGVVSTNSNIMHATIGDMFAYSIGWTAGGLGWFDNVVINTNTPIGSTPTPTPTPIGSTPTPTPTATPIGQTPTPTPIGQSPTPTPSSIGVNPTPPPSWMFYYGINVIVLVAVIMMVTLITVSILYAYGKTHKRN